nr:MAG TPA: hypothetical protein [Caudoviricetes sp.]
MPDKFKIVHMGYVFYPPNSLLYQCRKRTKNYPV